MSRLKAGEVAVDREHLKRMRDALHESGWLDLPALGSVTHFDHKDEHLQDARANVLEALDEVIHFLGIEDAYGDVTYPNRMAVPWSTYYEIFPRQVTYRIRGAGRFLADVRAANLAEKNNDAAKRLKAALKH